VREKLGPQAGKWGVLQHAYLYHPLQMRERYWCEPRQIKTQCQSDLYFLLWFFQYFNQWGTDTGLHQQQTRGRQVTGGSGIIFSCQVGTREQSCISLTAQSTDLLF